MDLGEQVYRKKISLRKFSNLLKGLCAYDGAYVAFLRDKTNRIAATFKNNQKLL